MTPTEAQAPPTLPGYRWLHRACLAWAGVGGAALLGMVVVTVVSIIGRSTIGEPVPGDFELVEVGCAVAIACFLPYCQLVGGNVVVDVLTEALPPRGQAALDLLGNLAFTGVAALLTWRMAIGGLELFERTQVTMVLRLPHWMPFIPVWLAVALLTLVGAYTAAVKARAIVRPNPLPSSAPPP